MDHYSGKKAETFGEAVRLGSERGEKDSVRNKGKLFLERSRTLIGE